MTHGVCNSQENTKATNYEPLACPQWGAQARSICHQRRPSLQMMNPKHLRRQRRSQSNWGSTIPRPPGSDKTRERSIGAVRTIGTPTQTPVIASGTVPAMCHAPKVPRSCGRAKSRQSCAFRPRSTYSTRNQRRPRRGARPLLARSVRRGPPFDLLSHLKLRVPGPRSSRGSAGPPILVVSYEGRAFVRGDRPESPPPMR